MFREKLMATFVWSTAAVAAAMAADFAITVLLLHDYAAYTPLVTFSIAAIVTVPITFAFVNGRFNLKKTRDELVLARDAALKADRAKSQFLANMSHELRTPLNAILGFAELLKLENYADRRAEYAALIHNSGTHLLGLVNDLLDLSRIEAGRQSLQSEDVDLRALMEECAATVEPRARHGNLRIVRTFDPALPVVAGDSRALKQILLNLLTNAIKFNQPGGLIEIFAHMIETGELVFGVKDNGMGIAEVDRAHLFERFGRGRHDICMPEKGAGLGLSIVKGLAEAHDGQVSLESQLGSGTCVTVRLPASRLDWTAAHAQLTPSKIAATSGI